MENVYDIRDRDKLLYILPINYSSYTLTEELASSVAVAVNLYYEDTVERYFEYLSRVCSDFAVYIISPKQSILDKAVVRFEGNCNIKIIKKENRGRDVSALLVAFRGIALQYKYICFLHDKKAKHDSLEEDIEIWIKNLWDNTIKTQKYVCNVLQILEQSPGIGLLVPPELLGKNVSSWYGDVWRDDFDNTVQLCKELDLQCDIQKNKMPITLGTVFWAKTACLEKLLIKPWTYEDFHEEPLPDSRTISHAIERILGYVAQDAGYKTGTILTVSYAEWSLLFIQKEIRKMHHILREEMGIQTFHQIDCLEEQESRIKDYFTKYEKVYLYGAGVYGKGLLKRIRQWGLLPAGFLVGNGKRNEPCIDGLKVYELGEISVTDNSGIIIAVNYNLQYEIEEDLKAVGFSDFIQGYI